MRRVNAVAKIFLTMSIALYTASLSQVGFCFALGNPPHPSCKLGISVLFLGWMQQLGFVADLLNYVTVISNGHQLPDISHLAHAWANLTWWANPLLWMSWVLIGISAKNWKTIVAFSVAALVSAGAFAVMKEALDCSYNSACTRLASIVNLGLGYWLWLTSMGAALVAAIFSSNIFSAPSNRSN